MAPRERWSWFRFVASLALLAAYAFLSLGWIDGDIMGPIFTLLAVLVLAVFVVVMAMQGVQKEDERDRIIRLKATGLASTILIGGVFFLTIRAGGFTQPASINTGPLLCVVWGALSASEAVMLYFYRRGVRVG